MRWSRLVLGGSAALFVLGGAFAARRVLSHPGTAPRAPSSHAAASAATSTALHDTPEPADSVSIARGRLEQFEAEARRSTDFRHLPPANRSHGADPYALAQLDATHLVGVLRGASAIVLLDTQAHELERVAVPGDAVTVAVSSDGACWVGGETSPTLSRFHFDGRHLQRSGELTLSGVLGTRALAAGPAGLLYALDVGGRTLLTLDPKHAENPVLDARAVGHGAFFLRRYGSYLIIDALLDHALLVERLDEQGRVLEERTRLQHDGPLWGFDAALTASGELVVAATGVEDHPLERADGSFGYIDSFAFVSIVPPSGDVRERLRQNVSELGVVTPKAPLLALSGEHARLFIPGYGSDRAVELFFDVHESAPPRAQGELAYPGVSASLRLASGVTVLADPLFDAWLLRPVGGTPGKYGDLRKVEAPEAPRASASERLGEALFFTTLMAPANSSEGKASRFSCEACHFEGYVDGRVHYTGRADVHATTKPLRGLFNNRPHFSRALDADLATVSHHEFRVAGKGNGQDPWFSLQRDDFPWLAQLGVEEPTLGPEALRRSLIAFLMRFSHTTNPAVVGRSAFDASEQRGARLFRDQCARCHAPRLQSDRPDSAVAFEAWPAAIFSAEGALVWASADYQKTGVTPYVHELGARVPSLRRLYVKWPYFTNGSAQTLLDVVRAARFDGPRFFHASAPNDAQLRAFEAEQAADVVAFLQLL